MKKLNLVLKFQERLEISREEAIKRISNIFFASLFYALVVFIYIYSFPFSRKIEILEINKAPGIKYESVLGIPESGILLGEDQFNELMSPGDTVFVSIGSGEGSKNITFLLKKNGFSFLKGKEIPLSLKNIFYSSNRVILKNDSIVVVAQTEIWFTLAWLFFVLILFLIVPSKITSYQRRKVYNTTLRVWW